MLLTASVTLSGATPVTTTQLAASNSDDIKSQADRLVQQMLQHFNPGEFDSAIELGMQALKLYQLINSRIGEANTLGNIGVAYRAQNDYMQSLIYLEKSLQIMQEIHNQKGEWTALQQLGLTNRAVGNYTKAKSYLEKQLIISNSPSERCRSLANLGLIEFDLGNYEAALKIMQEQLKIAGELQRKDLSETAYFNLGLVYETVGKLTEALDYYYKVLQARRTGEIKFSREKIKKVLADTILGDFVNNSRVSLIKNINIASRNSDRGVPSLVLKQGDAEAAARLRVRFKGDLRNWDAWEVIAVDTQNGKVTVRQPSYSPGVTDSRLITDISEIIGANPNASSPNAKNRNLQQLYQLLISPIADLLPSDPNARVIFIPQRELFYVPFAALQDDSGKYLIEKHTILTAPSIQVLQLTRTQKQQLPSNIKDALVVGNPIMPKVARQPGEQPQQLPPLPEAEKEALAIASFLKTQPLIGKDATKAAILPLLPKAKIVHLATHGLLDDRFGLGSAIALAPNPSSQDNTAQEAGDGLLTAAEIFNLKLSAELVVLSACDTGGGRITGDGVIGLSRSRSVRASAIADCRRCPQCHCIPVVSTGCANGILDDRVLSTAAT